MSEIDIVSLGLITILFGFILVVIGSMLKTKSRIESGGVILIGPFPIVWGSSKSMALLAVAVTIMFLLALVLFYLMGG